MRNYLDDTKVRTFEVTEYWKNRKEVWHFTGTNREMRDKAEGMRLFNGYIPGVGGDKNYRVVIVELTY